MRVIWSRPARDDIFAIADYYDSIDPDVAERIVDRIEISAAAWLLDFRSAGAPFGYRRWRTWRPRKTRYILIYKPTADGITVVRVRHARQDWRAVID